MPRKLIYASIIDAQNVLCYRKNEDRPLGFALQDAIPNHHKLLWSKTTVVSVMGKGEARLRQVRARELNKTEPVLTYRKADDVIKTRSHY